MRCRYIVPMLIVFVLFSSLSSFASVKIKKNKAGLLVSTSAYEMQLTSSADIVSLKSGGSSFLSSGNPNGVSGYFYQSTRLFLTAAKYSRKKVISTSSEKASLKIKYEDERITLAAENQTNKSLVYFIIVGDDSYAVSPRKGSYMKMAKKETTNKASFFAGKTKMTISGITSLWGPWSESQVCQITIGANSSTEIVITFSQTSKAELKKVAEFKPFNPLKSDDLELLSPLNYQVFQRDKKNMGLVRVRGKVFSALLAIEYRLFDGSDDKQDPQWKLIEFKKAKKEFGTELILPAGGWYRLEIRTNKTKTGTFELVVERFGVGEVFVGTGQSNSTNCGERTTQTETKMVSSFDGKRWRLADDPQRGCHDRSSRGSFWPAFGDAMYKKYKVPIGVAVTGHGGTSVNRWQPNGDLYEWMMTRMNQLGKNGFRAVLWHQGESDVRMKKEMYEKKLKNLIDTSKKDAGWKFPWFIAIATYHNPAKPRFESIRNAQLALIKKGVALEGPDTDLLGEPYRDKNGKGIHFSAKGLMAHGEAWAEKVSVYLDKVLKKK